MRTAVLPATSEMPAVVVLAALPLALPMPALPDGLPPLKPALMSTAEPLKLAVFCTSVMLSSPPVVKRLLPLLTAWLMLATTPPTNVMLLTTMT